MEIFWKGKEMGRVPSPNTAYTAHSVLPNLGFTETSYMLELLDDILHGELISKYNERKKKGVR